MPEELVTAEKDYRLHNIDETLYAQRLAARVPYQVRMVGTPEPGATSMRGMCPASGACPTMQCPHKPDSTRGTRNSQLPPVLAPPRSRPKCCSQQTVTISLTKNSKFRAQYPWEHPLRAALYAHFRNAVEGGHYRLKAVWRSVLGSTDSSRCWGTAAQSLLAAIATLGENMRISDTFAIRLAEGTAGPQAPKPRGRPSLRRADVSGDDDDEVEDATEPTATADQDAAGIEEFPKAPWEVVDDEDGGDGVA
jgi:hypothetical protein